MPSLTVKEIKAARPETGKDTFIADGGGLFLKVAANGRKSFVFRFTYGARRHLMTLGTYPELELGNARQKHMEARKTLDAGANPLQVNQSAQQALKTAMTVKQLGDEWLSRFIDKRFKNPDEVRRMLAVDIYPHIGRFLARDITSRDVALTINKVVDRGSPVQANRVLRTLKKLFAYAVEQSHIDSNPVTMTVKGAGGKEVSRERNLSLDEVNAVLNAFAAARTKTSWQVRSIIKLLLLTAQRSGEVCGMEWKHLNLNANVWTIPKEITKSERTHTVHLSSQAAALLKDIYPVTGEGRYVFRSENDDKRHIETRSLSQALRKRITASDLCHLEAFTPHDLRRTAASRMADMGVPPHVIEKILNHAMTGAMGVYNRADYFAERREALQGWGECIEKTMNDIAGNSVIPTGRVAGTSEHDDIYEIECHQQRKQIRELVNNEVHEGDGSLGQKARHALETGAKHIDEGRPTPAFMNWLGDAIGAVLRGDEKSIDRALRLQVVGRPKKDPYNDVALCAAMAHMRAFDQRQARSAAGTPAERAELRRTAKKRAIDLAYEIRHGETPTEHLGRGMIAESVKYRRDQIRKELNEIVRYSSLEADQGE